MSEHPQRLGYKKWDGFNTVLAVIVVLFLAFMFAPILSTGVRKNARRSSCQSNMKQLGLALTQYEQDNDGALPAYVQNTNGPDWREKTYPYIKSTYVYSCPDDRRSPVSSSVGAMAQSYTANHLGLDRQHHERGAFVAPDSPSLIMTMFSHPDKTILLVDSRTNGPAWNMTDPTFRPSTGRELYAHIPDHSFYQHPSGTINVLFADGHVKGIKPIATLTPVNLWTRDNSPFAGQELQNARAVLQHAEDE